MNQNPDLAATAAGAGDRPRWPAGIPYIVGNEACERFSFYGMKAVLWVYVVSLLSHLPKPAAEAEATANVHLFIAGVYAFPVVGAVIADRLLGKYRTIFWLSLVYCAGHAVLAVSDAAPQFVGGALPGLYLGLALIALGSGGIKPCVSANVGDQFDERNATLVPKIFQIFYFTINFGSFFSTILTPILYAKYGPGVAFGVPGVLMGIATLFFWAGRKKFVHVPPSPGGRLGLLDSAASIALYAAFAIPVFTEWSAAAKGLGAAVSFAVFVALFRWRQRLRQDGGFLNVVLYSLAKLRERRAGESFWAPARAKFGGEAVEGPPAVLRIMGVFAMVSVFWALFDQHSSSWVAQAARMDLVVNLPFYGELRLLAPQLSALNPLMVMVIIPLLNFVVFPWMDRAGLKITPLRRMTAGMFLASLAFVAVALLQMRIDALGSQGLKVPVLWQIVPYVVMTVAEVLVSATGLEFAYTQAPRSMKSTIMSFWLLTVTAGNLLVALLAPLQELSLARFFWVFAALMAVAAAVFGVAARYYKGRTYLQAGGAGH